MIFSSVDILLPLSVALLDPRENLFLGKPPAREIEVQQLGDVPGAEQGEFAASLESHLHSEQQRQAGEADMVMPSPPYPHLILRHANLAFGLMKRMLNPEPLALDPTKAPPRPLAS